MFSKRNAPKARCLEMLGLQLTRKRDHFISGSAFYFSGNTEHHLGRELANPHIPVRHTEETDTSDWGCSILKYLTACASEHRWHQSSCWVLALASANKVLRQGKLYGAEFLCTSRPRRLRPPTRCSKCVTVKATGSETERCQHKSHKTLHSFISHRMLPVYLGGLKNNVRVYLLVLESEILIC